jgi:PAS domain S-box-containing protein
MHRRLPISNDSSEIGGGRELIHPAKINVSIFRSLDNLPKRSPAMYVISGAPGKIARTTGVEEMDRDLHQARDNFATIFNASPAMLCIIQLNGLQYREINKAYEQSTGYSRSEVLGKASLNLGLWSNAEDRKRMLHKLLANGRLRGEQAVFQTKTGEPLITFLSAEIIEFGGEPCVLMVAEDITMRRQAEEVRMDLAQRLINAQEAECSSVARDLHDNIGQSLAMFSMELQRTKLALTDLSPEDEARFASLTARLKTLGRKVSDFSHQLHSSELELLGIAVAVKALCREFSEQYQVQAHYKCSGVLDNLSAEVSLCLFRVIQEALHNVAKHSRAIKVDVELRGTLDSVYLCISDDGVGFANTSKARAGLGLISMRERLLLIGGKFTITSKPGSGTRVEANIPFRKTSSATVSLQRSAALKDKHRPDSPA